MRAGRNKLFIKVDGRPVVLYTLDVFTSDPECKKIILAVQPHDEKAQHIVNNGLKVAGGQNGH